MRSLFFLLAPSLLAAAPQSLDIVISEINYHPPPGSEALQFVELYNRGTAVMSLSTWALRGDGAEPQELFLFPAGTELPPRHYLVVAADPQALRDTYGTAGVLGPLTRSLARDGEQISLVRSDGALVEAVRFGDGDLELADPALDRGAPEWAPGSGLWPHLADGLGATLERKDPFADERLRSAWQASAPVGGSPGQAPAAVPEARFQVRINEVRSGGAFSFVELYLSPRWAPGAEGCAIRSAEDPELSQQVPAGAVGSFAVIPVQSSLASSELLLLLAEDGRTLLDAFPVRHAGTSGVSARYPDGAEEIYATQVGTPGAPNERPSLPELLFTEIMYCPPARDGFQGEDLKYVAISNRGSEAVPLEGFTLTGCVYFAFEAGQVIEPGQELVLGRNPAALHAVWSVAALGPWQGSLGPEAGTVVLRDQSGNCVDRVSYGPYPPESRAGGSSLSLRSALLENDWQEAWEAAPPNPGQAPASSESPPLVVGVRHSPAVPAPNEQITITCRIVSEAPVTSAEIRFQQEGGGLRVAQLRDDGQSGDGGAGDRVWGASIGSFGREGTVAFHVVAASALGTTDAPGSGRDFLLRVEATAPPQNGFPALRLVLKDSTLRELTERSVWSDELLDATCIDQYGEVHYNVGVAYRGGSRRVRESKSVRIVFFTPGGFQGRHQIFINLRNPQKQFLSFNLFHRAGLPAPCAAWVNLFFGDAWEDKALLVEPVDLFLAHRLCGGGPSATVLYHGVRTEQGQADLTYRGEDPASYRPFYVPEDPAGYVDQKIVELTALTDPSVTGEEDFARQVPASIDVAQWSLFFAAQAVLSNAAPNLALSSGEDYSVLLRRSDGRAILLPGELDETFDSATEGLFRPALAPVRRFLTQPSFARLYYGALLALTDGAFSRIAMRRALRTLEPMYSFSQRDSLETYVARRLGYLYEQVPQRITVGVRGVSAARVIGRDELWRYFKGRSDPSGGDLSWSEVDFDDSAWSEAVLPIGYGGRGERTGLSDMRNGYTTLFARKRFVLADPSSLQAGALRVTYDDGVVVYLNGEEILRRNAPAGAPRFQWRATDTTVTPEQVEIDLSAFRAVLRPGANVLAACGCNNDPGSRDFYLDVEFLLGSGPAVGGGIEEQAFVTGSEVLLAGRAPASETAQVRVNGQPASFDPVAAWWEATAPVGSGTTDILIESVGEAGLPLAQKRFQVHRVEGFAPLSGEISGALTLTSSQSPYRLTGTVRVRPGAVLRIEPGVAVLAEGDASIVVEGRIEASGTETSPVVFLSSRLDGLWQGIAMNQTGTGSSDPVQLLRHCRFVGGIKRSDASGFLNVRQSRVSVENCSFECFRANAIDGRDAEVTIVGSSFFATYEAVHFATSVVTIRQSTFRELIGDKDAIDFDGDGRSPSRVEACVIDGSMDDGVDLAGSTCVVAGSKILRCGDKGLSFEGDGRHGHPVIRDNILYGNGTAVALKNGAVVQEGLHNTIVGNEEGIRIYAKSAGGSGARGNFSYCIVWHNRIDVEVDDRSRGSFSYCDVGGEEIIPGEGNIAADPLFTGEAQELFFLRPESPCILEEGRYMGALAPCGEWFIRGDANTDWRVDISDSVSILLYLFDGTPAAGCLDACDANDDGTVSIADCVYVLQFLFAGGAPPPSPFPQAGSDPTGDDLSCAGGLGCL